MWLVQAEAQFAVRNIVADDTKYYYAVARLLTIFIADISDTDFQQNIAIILSIASEANKKSDKNIDC